MVDADPQTQPEDRLTVLRVGGLIALLICGAAAAADLEIVPKREERAAPAAPPPLPPPPLQLQTTNPPEAPAPGGSEKPTVTEQAPPDTLTLPQAGAPPQGESWWQQIVREAPTCKTFSDGCRTCNSSYSCSGLPIACQPKEFTCVDPK